MFHHHHHALIHARRVIVVPSSFFSAFFFFFHFLRLTQHTTPPTNPQLQSRLPDARLPPLSHFLLSNSQASCNLQWHLHMQRRKADRFEAKKCGEHLRRRDRRKDASEGTRRRLRMLHGEGGCTMLFDTMVSVAKEAEGEVGGQVRHSRLAQEPGQHE